MDTLAQLVFKGWTRDFVSSLGTRPYTNEAETAPWTTGQLRFLEWKLLQHRAESNEQAWEKWRLPRSFL
jgi:hypothetical protein